MSKLKLIGLATLNLLALAGFTSQNVDKAQDAHTENLNLASLKSIEGSWVRVPAICKAAAFNAQPVSVKADKMSFTAMKIYQSYQV